MTHYLTIVTVVMVVLISLSAEADFGDAYYTNTGVFAQEVVPTCIDINTSCVKRGYRNATYLPYYTIVFIDDEVPVPDVLGTDKVAVTTQHGLPLFVQKNQLSSRSFNREFGDRYEKLVFHQDAELCSDPTKLPCRDSEVRRGEVLGIRISGETYMELRIKRTNEDNPEDNDTNFRSVFGTQRQINEMVRGGIATDMRNQYPRYLISGIEKLDPLSLNCGELQKSVDESKITGKLTAKVSTAKLLSLFGFELEASAEAEKSKTYTKTVERGQSGRAYDYYVLVVAQPDASGDFGIASERIFAISAEKVCAGRNEGPQVVVEKLNIIEVTMTPDVNEEQDLVQAILSIDKFYPGEKIDEIAEGKSKFNRIFQKNSSRTFLTSINNRLDYEAALKIWSYQIPDAAMANIFLSLFNAGCRGANRDECYSTLAISKN